MSSADSHLTDAAIRARVRQRLAASDPNVQEEAIIEVLFPDPQEQRLTAECWRGEITAVRQLTERYYQEVLQRGEPVPLAEQTVNLRLCKHGQDRLCWVIGLEVPPA